MKGGDANVRVIEGLGTGSGDLPRIATEVLVALEEILALKEGAVHDDIRRGKALISDAVVKLGDSFNGLSSQSRAQQQLVAALIDEVSRNKSGGRIIPTAPAFGKSPTACRSSCKGSWTRSPRSARRAAG